MALRQRAQGGTFGREARGESDLWRVSNCKEEKGGARIPLADVSGHGLSEVEAGVARDGKEDGIFGLVANGLEERLELADDLIVAHLVPVDGGIIELVHGHDDLANAQRLGENGMLTGLTRLVEAGLKLTLAGRDDEDADVRLRDSLNHVGHVRLVAGCIHDGVALLLR